MKYFLFIIIKLMSSFTCYICSNSFAQKKNLQRHLIDKTCKSVDLIKVVGGQAKPHQT